MRIEDERTHERTADGMGSCVGRSDGLKVWQRKNSWHWNCGGQTSRNNELLLCSGGERKKETDIDGGDDSLRRRIGLMNKS